MVSIDDLSRLNFRPNGTRLSLAAQADKRICRSSNRFGAGLPSKIVWLGDDHRAGLQSLSRAIFPFIPQSGCCEKRRAIVPATTNAEYELTHGQRVSIQQSPKIYGGKELSNYYKRLLLAGR
jgi:hypothetical protein